MPVDKEIYNRVKARRDEIRTMESTHPVHPFFRRAKAHTEEKLTAVRGYLYAYTKSIGGKVPGLYYIETHAGPGCSKLAHSGRVLLGTPLLAVTNEPAFSACRFVEIDPICAEALETRLKKYAATDIDWHVIRGDCNEMLPAVLDGLPGDFPRLVFMDPEGLELDFRTIEIASRHLRSELLILFPYDMAIRRLLGPTVEPTKQVGISRLLGGEDWRATADDLAHGRISPVEAKHRLLESFRERVHQLGFPHVVISKQIESKHGLPLYHLFHASRYEHAARIGKDIFAKGQGLPTTLAEFNNAT